MPEIGEIRKGTEIGRKDSNKLIYQACEICGKAHWVEFLRGKPKHTRCNACAHKEQSFRVNQSISHRGAKNTRWKGGRTTDGRGYIKVKLSPDDFFYSMADKCGYVLEHRLVYAQHEKRCLQPWEIIHHKDGIRDHNVWENLEKTTKGNHATDHNKGYRDGYQQGLLDGRLKQLEELKEQNRELKQEIRLLRWELKEERARSYNG